ncbi:MAG: hypothetical protein KDD70_13005 [Bdellovibrionales bacterium]|nr:hypothetical protein [Bdellovibrionales bacterium]
MQDKSENRAFIPLLIVISSSLSLLAIPYGLFECHDYLLHLKWASFFSEQLYSGELYPRWLYADYRGFGSPVFYFYPPLPYYVSALFIALFARTEVFWLGVTISGALSLVVATLAMYWWLRTRFSLRASFFASLYYLLAPYHFGIDFYTRFSLAELWSFVWLPLIFISLDKYLKGNRKALLSFSLYVALLTLSHLLIALITFPFLLGYVWMLSESNKSRTLFFVVAALTLGVALSAFYWLPAVLSIQEAQSLGWGRHGYAENFVFFFGELGNPLRVFRIYICLISVSTLVLLFVTRYGVSGKMLEAALPQREVNMWFAFGILSFFMSTPLSWPIWSLITPLQSLQFPWRFLSLTTFASTVLVAHLAQGFQTFTTSLTKILSRITFAVLFALSISLTLLHLMESYRLFSSLDQKAIQEYVFNNLRPHEYLPRAFQTMKPAEVETWQSALPVKEKSLLYLPTPISQTNLIPLDEKHLEQVTIPHFYHPSWRAYGISSKESISLRSDRYGLITFQRPAEEQTLVLDRTLMPVEKIARLLSAVALLCLLILYFQCFLPVSARLSVKKHSVR